MWYAVKYLNFFLSSLPAWKLLNNGINNVKMGLLPLGGPLSFGPKQQPHHNEIVRKKWAFILNSHQFHFYSWIDWNNLLDWVVKIKWEKQFVGMRYYRLRPWSFTRIRLFTLSISWMPFRIPSFYYIWNTNWLASL